MSYKECHEEMKPRIEAEKMYAALKLIESLFVDGKISKHVWKNIKNDYKEMVDLSQFK